MLYYGDTRQSTLMLRLHLVFLEVARSFVHKVPKELEASDRDGSPVAMHKKDSRHSESIRSPQFVQRVQIIMDANNGIRVIARGLQVTEGAIRNVVLSVQVVRVDERAVHVGTHKTTTVAPKQNDN